MLMSKVSYWLRVLVKSVNKRKLEKREEDLGRSGTQEYFQRFDKTGPVGNAVKILSEFMTTDKQIVIKEFTLVRDYLINVLYGQPILPNQVNKDLAQIACKCDNKKRCRDCIDSICG